MSFFDPPPRPPEPPSRPAPNMWWRRPDWEVGEPVPADVMLVRTDAVAVAVRNVAAFSTGVSFVLAIRTTAGLPPVHGRHRHHLHRRSSKPLPDDVFRFGVELADGRRATIFDEHPHGAAASAIALLPGRGSSTGAGWDESYWLAPLPPPGPLAFVCEWPVAGIPLTRAELDAGAILAAVAG
jgi:hypothetical protein